MHKLNWEAAELEASSEDSTLQTPTLSVIAIGEEEIGTAAKEIVLPQQVSLYGQQKIVRSRINLV